MNDPEPIPPWIVTPGRYEAYWIQGNDPYVHSTWRPFWWGLNEEQRLAYLSRFPVGASWQEFLLDVDLDQAMARSDAEDNASGGLQPNGSPWPKPTVIRSPLWRRLLGWRHSKG